MLINQKEFDEWFEIEANKCVLYSSGLEMMRDMRERAWSACEAVMQKEIDELTSRSCETCEHCSVSIMISPMIECHYHNRFEENKDFCCKYWSKK